jgi:hypothetical protein
MGIFGDGGDDGDAHRRTLWRIARLRLFSCCFCRSASDYRQASAVDINPFKQKLTGALLAGHVLRARRVAIIPTIAISPLTPEEREGVS